MAYLYVPWLGLLSKTVGLLKDCNETQENYRLLGSITCSPVRFVRMADWVVLLLDCARLRMYCKRGLSFLLQSQARHVGMRVGLHTGRPPYIVEASQLVMVHTHHEEITKEVCR